jgi:hypothetical protein
MMRVYAKALAACIPALLAIIKMISDAAGVGHVTSTGWASVAVTVLGAVAVYATPNAAPAVPPGPPTLLTAPAPRIVPAGENSSP